VVDFQLSDALPNAHSVGLVGAMLDDTRTASAPPFIVGATYDDEDGKYKVLSVEGARMTFERQDGSKGQTENIPLKAR
jgi:hypothetical protein